METGVHRDYDPCACPGCEESVIPAPTTAGGQNGRNGQKRYCSPACQRRAAYVRSCLTVLERGRRAMQISTQTGKAA